MSVAPHESGLAIYDDEDDDESGLSMNSKWLLQ
jgi:hypothetical protein